MIVIVGGASRAGKGMISRRLMPLMDLPYVSIDPLKMALARSIPQYPLNTNGGSIEVAQQLWPFLSAYMHNLIETGMKAIIEGEILPEHAHEFCQTYPHATRACFVGYCNISVTEKMKQIREHAGLPNDWSSTLSDSDLNDLVEESIEYSCFVKEECRRLNMTYFDCSNDFLSTNDAVVHYLSQNQQSGRP